MKTLKEIGKRIKDLIIKLLGVKSALAIAAFVAFLRDPNEFTFGAFLVFGGLLVVGREYGKLLELIRATKGLPRIEM